MIYCLHLVYKLNIQKLKTKKGRVRRQFRPVDGGSHRQDQNKGAQYLIQKEKMSGRKEKAFSLLGNQMGQTAQSVSVIIPAYNEEKTIGQVIANTLDVMDSQNLPYEIIVVDDGSTDKTGRIASQCKATLLTNLTNKGKGYSLRRGFYQAQGEIVVTIDSDGEHQPKEIPDLLESVLEGADIVVGSRFLGKSRRFTTRLNSVGNSIFNFAIMSLTGILTTDSQSGFRAVKRGVLTDLSLESDGYEIETEITVKGIVNGFVFKEKPITCHRRQYGPSKIKILRDGIKILKTILISSLRA